MVNKVWEKGSRKDLYEVERDWYQTFGDFFAIKWRKAVEMNLLVLRKSLSELKALAAREPDDETLQRYVQDDLDKINQAIAYYLWLDRLIDAMESGDIYSLVPKEEDLSNKS